MCWDESRNIVFPFETGKVRGIKQKKAIEQKINEATITYTSTHTREKKGREFFPFSMSDFDITTLNNNCPQNDKFLSFISISI